MTATRIPFQKHIHHLFSPFGIIQEEKATGCQIAGSQLSATANVMKGWSASCQRTWRIERKIFLLPTYILSTLPPPLCGSPHPPSSHHRYNIHQSPTLCRSQAASLHLEAYSHLRTQSVKVSFHPYLWKQHWGSIWDLLIDVIEREGIFTSYPNERKHWIGIFRSRSYASATPSA